MLLTSLLFFLRRNIRQYQSQVHVTSPLSLDPIRQHKSFFFFIVTRITYGGLDFIDSFIVYQLHSSVVLLSIRTLKKKTKEKDTDSAITHSRL